MLTLLTRIFIKDRENYSNARVRSAYVMLCGFFGIFLNILLFVFKYMAGILSGSIAITADAFNNLTDASASVITLLGFRLAAAAPDAGHPFGHGRIEYLSGAIVSVIIVVVGFELGRNAVAQIISPTPIDTGLLPMGILAMSILVKFYMFAYNRSIGGKINSPGMLATAKDSISDFAATTVVLLSMLAARLFDVNVDGWSGLAVACFIAYSGFTALRDTLNPLLGNPPAPELVHAIYEIVLSHTEIINIHDLIVHDYGPGRLIISLHAGDGDIFTLHDAIDTAESELSAKLGCTAVIHMDPISTNDSKVNAMREALENVARTIDDRITIHDFRIVEGPTHTNVIFDAVLPFGCGLREKDITARLEAAVCSLWENACPKVQIDRSYI